MAKTAKNLVAMVAGLVSIPAVIPFPDSQILVSNDLQEDSLNSDMALLMFYSVVKYRFCRNCSEIQFNLNCTYRMCASLNNFGNFGRHVLQDLFYTAKLLFHQLLRCIVTTPSAGQSECKTPLP